MHYASGVARRRGLTPKDTFGSDPKAATPKRSKQGDRYPLGSARRRFISWLTA